MTGTLGWVFAAAVFFVASHMVLSAPAVRGALVGRLGELAFRGVYSGVALAGLVWLIRAYGAAPDVALWPAWAWTRWVPLAAMPFAAILLVCGLTVRSPTAIGGGAPSRDRPAPGILAVTRHPVLWAIALWALAHIAANGDAASLMLFGALALLSFGGMPSIDRKRRDAMGDSWGPVARSTSILPFVALAKGRARLDFAEIGAWRIAAGVALYAALLFAHGPLIGVAILP